MSKASSEMNVRYGVVWHNSRKPAYGGSKFSLMEELYKEGRNMCVDLRDLGSLADRLKDFIGKKRNKSSVESEFSSKSEFVDLIRIKALKRIKSSEFDLKKLIRLCKELNVAYENKCFLSVAMLVRATLDHVPPIFVAAKLQ